MKFVDRGCEVLVFAATLIFLSDFAYGQEQASFAAIHSDDAVTILEGVRPVLTYQKGLRSDEGQWPRNHYIHPLYDLDGNSITEDFPSDHGHHRGLFWTWHQILVRDKPVGDAWLCENFEWDVRSVEVARQLRSTSMDLEVHWTSPEYRDAQGNQVAFVREKATILIHASEPNFRCIDFDLRLNGMVQGVRIGGSNDSKGYGGFSPRIRLEKGVQFTSTTGDIEPTKNAVEAGPWINITSHGRGFAMMSHPKNPAPRNRWILRAQGSMQNAVFPGRELIAVDTETPLRLRYRIVLHRGDLSPESLENLHRDYASNN